MRLESIQAIFGKINRYQRRRNALKLPNFITETIYTLTELQIAEINKQKLNPEEFMRSHMGLKVGVQFQSVECKGEPFTFEDIFDLAEDLTKTVWDCKDRILKAAINHNINRDAFWNEVKKNKELCIIADLANSIKHDGLTKPPLSGIKPEINGVRNSSAGYGCSEYTQEENKIIVKHSLIHFEIFAAIRDIENPMHEIGEVFNFCEIAVTQWETIIQRLNLKLLGSE